MKMKMKWKWNNTKGDTVFEIITAIVLLLLLGLMMASSFLASYKHDNQTTLEYIRITEAYHQIEDETQTTTDSSLHDSSTTSTLTFTYNGADIEIDGKFIYDDEQEKIGEFRPD